MGNEFVSTLIYALFIGLPVAFVLAAVIANVRKNHGFDIEEE